MIMIMVVVTTKKYNIRLPNEKEITHDRLET